MASFSPAGSQLRPELADLTALKLVLFGGSAIDLTRSFFANRQAVDTYLRLAGFDTDNSLDLARLQELHHEAIGYLTDVHRYRLPLQIESPPEVHTVFTAAADVSSQRLQRFACMTLKVMHIMHHISGRELVFNTPISEAQLFDRLNGRVFNLLDRLRAEGIGLLEFTAGKKSTASLATKLLAKRNNLATHIFDKVRFRIVVRSRDDIVLTLVHLLRNLVPFNYVLPEQSQNSIIGAADVARALDLDPDMVGRHWPPPPLVETAVSASGNVFSGDSYRCVNFVADIPLRIDDVAPHAAPAIAFVQTEIQLIDQETAWLNERGENAHALYKKRQRAHVRARLEGQALRPPADRPAVGDAIYSREDD